MPKKFSPKHRKAISKGLKKYWRSMTSLERRRKVPSRTKPKRRYPIGSYIMLDVGKPKGHYQFVKKVKYGWKKARPPKSIRKFQVEGKKGYVLLTKKAGRLMTRKARRKWKSMSHKARVKAMPSWSKARRLRAKRMR